MKFNFNHNYFIIIVGALLVSFTTISCSSGGQQGRGRGQQVKPLPVLQLQPRTIELTQKYPATLEGSQTLEIRPRLQGYITKMAVDEGDIVEEGELLFKLNSEQYEQEVRSAKADVKAAKAGVSTAKDEVERQKNLVEKDIVSNYQLQSAKNKLQSKKASLAQARARLENAQVNLGYTKINSPADGIIGTIPYRKGSLVSSTISKPLTVLSDISKMYAYFSMGERELLDMSQAVATEGGNRTLRQRIAEMPKVNLVLPDETIYNHKGKIKLASGLIDQQTGSASFRAVFPNPKEILRSGGSANVQIPLEHDDAIIVPKKSTYEIQNKRFVYTVTDSNTVESTEINTNPLSTKTLFVVDKGLQSSDKIVTTGLEGLNDGDKIKPQPVNTDSLYRSMMPKSN